ncbi:MAG: molybdopterin-dependent oxidoreductase [Verrucomicrobia bacterium]|nr:molybdopterin-dependent oxidoreductase [Verrucomicrobiota bacterium]
MKRSTSLSARGATRWLLPGFFAGLIAGVVMLLIMALLRLFGFVPTPTELIFDRAFPLVSIDFFIWSLVQANGYTPLKLSGIFAALAGQLFVAGLAGAIYAWISERVWVERDAGFLRRSHLSARSWWLVVPGVVAVWLLFVALLGPQLLTNYRGLPPARATFVSCLGMLVSFGVCGWTLAHAYALLTQPRPTTVLASDDPAAKSLARRRFLVTGIGALAAVALGGALRRLFRLGTFAYDGTEYLGPDVQKITPNDRFYQVTKNLVDPDVARDLWRLEFTGHVEAPRVLTFAELTALPAVEQETTLQCISYRVGGGLISNALWKGVPLPALLAIVRPKADAVAVLFHAADGYFETFSIAKAHEPTTLVVWEMNGAPLTPRHGFPVRLVVPGLYGERSAKWVTRLEFLAANDPLLQRNRHGVKGVGFYTEQGWGPNIVVPTTSRFDAPKVAGDRFAEPFTAGQPVELRGMAFGGDQGISKVEVSFDDGETWQDAPITAPGSNKLSWSLWTLAWTPAAAGDHRLQVRATNGAGELQSTEQRNTVPQGALGLHKVRATVVAARA